MAGIRTELSLRPHVPSDSLDDDSLNDATGRIKVRVKYQFQLKAIACVVGEEVIACMIQAQN